MSPIVVVDMPFVGRSGRARPIESGRPRWHNPAEAGIVVQLMSHLKLVPSEKKTEWPSLAVLAPYRQQVQRLHRQLEALRAKERPAFADFAGFAHGDRICGTVDSSQGSEADLVVVSLVRNNQSTGPPALGFLRDRRRMNVLLSRARQQLVIVGSMEFLKESTRHSTMADDELSFVLTFLETIERLRGEKTAQKVAKVSVITPAVIAMLGS